MALTTYSELITTCAETLARDDMAGPLSTCVRLIEDQLNYGAEEGDRGLRTRDMITTTTISGTDGVFALPSDFLEVVQIKDGYGRALTSVALDWAANTYQWVTSAASACEYAILGGDILTYPPYSGDLTFSYYAALANLSDDAPTNWLLTKVPSLYYYGTLAHSAPYIKDDTRITMWGGMYKSLLAGLKSADNMSRYSRIVSRVAGPTP
jgi:hypothetical protein